MRTYCNLDSSDETRVRESLLALADKDTGMELYRKAFTNLGQELGHLAARHLSGIDASEIMLVCASEDADWLTAGVQEGIGKGELPISVYWSDRSTIYDGADGDKIEISPIVKAYEEPMKHCSYLIVVKSIISSSCVVKTQLNRLIGKLLPENILILAPVMYVDGIPNLKKEFPEQISDKFIFYSFAIDNERQGNEVIPGIGGMVYPRLGIDKASYVPNTVISRLR